MRESELHHLTAMAVLNLRLTRQLQQDVAEDEKIAHIQLEMTKLKEELAEALKSMDEVKEGVECHNLIILLCTLPGSL